MFPPHKFTALFLLFLLSGCTALPSPAPAGCQQLLSSPRLGLVATYDAVGTLSTFDLETVFVEPSYFHWSQPQGPLRFPSGSQLQVRIRSELAPNITAEGTIANGNQVEYCARPGNSAAFQQVAVDLLDTAQLHVRPVDALAITKVDSGMVHN